MDEAVIRQAIESIVCEQFARKGLFFVPVASSNRHIHLSQEHVDALFGKGHVLKKLRDLKQPGQYACEEQVVFKTDKGSLKLRVVGPIRPNTQIELSASECIKLGLKVEVRMSGDTKGTPGGTLSTELGTVALTEGVMVAARHLHLSDEQAKLYGLKTNDKVRLFVEGPRATVFENVVVRCGSGHTLEAHIDIEEANAAMLPKNAVCRIEKQQDHTYLAPAPTLQQGAKGIHGNVTPSKEAPIYAMSGFVNEKRSRGTMPEPSKKRLVTEADILAVHKNGQRTMRLERNMVLTPLARDRAKTLGIEFE